MLKKHKKEVYGQMTSNRFKTRRSKLADEQYNKGIINHYSPLLFRDSHAIYLTLTNFKKNIYFNLN